MSAAPKRRLEAIQHQLAPDAGKFEDIPRIRKVAADSTVPYAICWLSVQC
jgi:hypothetical protein